MLDSSSKLSLGMVISVLLSSCATTSGDSKESSLIENPFGSYRANGNADHSNDVTLRSKQGDRALEISLPQDQNSEIQVPMNQKFSQNTRDEGSSADGVDYQYTKQKPTVADREIASTFTPASTPESDAKRREIESSLGLQASDELPHNDESYLAKVDIAKQLFRSGRLEACLIELDHISKEYPTSARVFEMRGTVLDRLGYTSLAVKSWKQALEFDPSRIGLKKLIEKREQQRNVASEKK